MENTNAPSKQFEVAEIQLSYKSIVKPSQRPKITGSKSAKEVLMQSWDQSRIELFEQFKVLLVNRANRVLGILELSTGGIAGTVADPKLIFAAALKAAASGIILSHNHPSGSPQPSDADIQLTKKVKGGCSLLEIKLLDHIIVTSEECYYSFSDEGML